ncbi:pyridoxal 5'-phosphate synthase glutaminase subunit PdxT [Candidatus Peregrinibacteria bacterium]|nr:pyridoxal 5'-phosphate synthase glutaminase subunit PdxT [Candidatus Peregrinibacteria bacterium]
MKKTIGVLAFQGGVIEHKKILSQIGAITKEVRSIQDLETCNALIIPGGESTTIGFFLQESGLMKVIQQKAKENFPIWGTCAGAILLAKHIKADIIPPHLGLMDITVERNAYGRQLSSFEAELEIPELKIKDLQAAFIRAPIITSVLGKAKVLAKHKNDIVLVKEGNLLASTFHPELVGETRLHQYFLELLKS